jgi:hypothetical protein
MESEVYFSTDIESDGPIPGHNSMLSFGTVAFSESGEELGTFTRNLELLPGAVQNPSTMAWWAKSEQTAAWKACRENLVSPEQAMLDYVSWVKTFKGEPVFVAYPAGFDFNFMFWYMIRFAGENPFSFSALDIKSYVMAVLKKPYRKTVKKNMPKSWFSSAPHTHVAIDDAREQGLLFLNAKKANKTR